jgi:hypothetical protein
MITGSHALSSQAPIWSVGSLFSLSSRSVIGESGIATAALRDASEMDVLNLMGAV